MTNKQIMANELIKAVEKYRIDSHLSFEQGAQDAIRELERLCGPAKKRRKLLTDSEFLNSKRSRKRCFGRRWWPCVNWRIRKAGA